ncbi:MAG: N-formylglutamate amidohydrolase [Deltaproteobacteria bacterium]|nr:N-formylglutamate amidohydrolase [Deltaproteobacteria bacterium]
MSLELRALLITCEHGGAVVPAAYRRLFAGHARLLASHRGYDPGAANLARRLAHRFHLQADVARVTRLLVDLNRSVAAPSLFSSITGPCSAAEKIEILRRHYLPHRQRVLGRVRRAIREHGTVLHLAVHSFTPVLGGVRRTADVGLLYDPSRAAEVAFCRAWQRELAAVMPSLRVRRNYPYRGRSDGLCTSLRRHFDPRTYVGVELEVSQRFARSAGAASRALQIGIETSLGRAAARFGLRLRGLENRSVLP